MPSNAEKTIAEDYGVVQNLAAVFAQRYRSTRVLVVRDRVSETAAKS